MNPGPIKYPCGNCGKPVRTNQKDIMCEYGCGNWFHLKCIDLTTSKYLELSDSSEDWYCNSCTLPVFTDSYFDISLEESSTPSNDDIITATINNNNQTVFKQLRESRKRHPRNVLIAYLNINSVRYKFDEIKELLTDHIVDILFLAETKLDETFNNTLFTVDGYKLYRPDRNCSGGGIMSLISSNLPSSRKETLESEFPVENISHEIYINDKKWLIMGAYKPPSIKNDDFSFRFSQNLDKIIVNYDNYIVLGDFNFDILNMSKVKQF